MSETVGSIADPQVVTGEIVLSERVVTNEFIVVEIFESITNRFVRAEVELGPFVTTDRPDGSSETRGSSRRGVVVWENAEYDAVRDTWRNEDLIAKIKTIFES